MKKKYGNKVLWMSYFAIFISFIFLNINSILDVKSYVSLMMLLIVGIIIYYAWKRHLCLADEMIEDINTVNCQILEDINDKNEFLWNKYKENSTLFKVKEIQTAYDNYHQEMLRLEKNVTSGYVCDIEDFINYDLFDSAINKGLLNLIPGVMTGLGILGTFIGLSFGLQSFNTGTAEEISNSIAPLMEGIKVAFHTSIYGMVMSLVFNFIYKKKIENGYRVVDEFLNIWRRRIVPNSDNEGMNRILQYQDKLATDMNNISENVIENMALKLSEILLPQYEKIHLDNGKILEATSNVGQEVANTIHKTLVPEFVQLNGTLSSFAEVVTKAQVEGVNQMVDSFINKLNETLADRFAKLAKVIDDTCDLQKENSDLQRETIDWINNTVKEISSVNMDSQQTVVALQNYIEKITELQKLINEDISLFDTQLEKNSKLLEMNDQYHLLLQGYIQQIVVVTENFGQEMQSQATALQDISKQTVDGVQESLEMIKQNASEQMKLTAEASREYAKEVTEQMQKEVTNLGQEMQSQATALQDISKQTVDGVQESLEMIKQNASEQMKLTAEASREYAKEVTEQMQKEISNIGENTKNQLETIIKFIEESEKNIEDQTNRIHEISNKTIEGIDEILKEVSLNAKEQMEESARAAEEIVKRIETQVTTVLTTVEHEAEKNISSISQMQKESAEYNQELVSTTTGLLSQVNSYTDGMQFYVQNFADELSNKLDECTNAFFKEMQSVTKEMRTDITASVDTVNKEIVNSINAIREMENLIRNSHGDNVKELNKQMEGFIKTLTAAVKDQMQQIVEYKKQTNVDLNKATKQLYDAALKLDMDVQESLEKTFDTFDKNLTTITSHLSGTIAEVDNTTKRVPAVVNASYEGMEKSMEQMEANLQTLVKELNKLVREISKKK